MILTLKQMHAPSLLSRLAQRLDEWLQFRRDMSELAVMSDRQLADIGLARADLEALRKGRFVDARKESPQTTMRARKAPPAVSIRKQVA